MEEIIDLAKLAEEAAKEYRDDHRSSPWCRVWHRWSKWRPDHENNEQNRYCLACNLVQKRPLAKACWHTWYVRNQYDVSREGALTGQMFINRCSKCGELRKQDFQL